MCYTKWAQSCMVIAPTHQSLSVSGLAAHQEPSMDLHQEGAALLYFGLPRYTQRVPYVVEVLHPSSRQGARSSHIRDLVEAGCMKSIM